MQDESWILFIDRSLKNEFLNVYYEVDYIFARLRFLKVEMVKLPSPRVRFFFDNSDKFSQWPIATQIMPTLFLSSGQRILFPMIKSFFIFPSSILRISLVWLAFEEIVERENLWKEEGENDKKKVNKEVKIVRLRVLRNRMWRVNISIAPCMPRVFSAFRPEGRYNF